MTLKKYCFVLMFVICTFNSFAQDPPPPGSGEGNTGGSPGGGVDPGNGETPTGAVPFEGIGILIAAGVGYGAKKVYDSRKKRQKDGESGSSKE